MRRVLNARVELLPHDCPGRFLGCDVPKELLVPDIELMRRTLGRRAQYYEYCFALRYFGKHHVTLVNPVEFKLLPQGSVDEAIGREVSIEFIGLGRVRTDAGDSFFSVCKSEDMLDLRAKLGLKKYNLHATLGFKKNDLHNVDKSIATLLGTFIENT